MNVTAKSHWPDDRLRAQETAYRRRGTYPPYEMTGHKAFHRSASQVYPRPEIVPSWVIFLMVMFAMAALCINLTVHTHREAVSAADQYEQLKVQVDALALTNAALRANIRRLSHDPATIERYARTRLKMVRANEIVVPVE